MADERDAGSAAPRLDVSRIDGGRRLAALGLADDPIGRPLTYPGRLPPESGLLVDGCFLAVREDPGRSPGGWRMAARDGVLDEILRARRRPLIAERRPVLAVGSNGSPAQVRRKLVGRAVDGTVPMTYATVSGIAAGVSAHVSAPGYVPATPLPAPGRTGRFIVVWLDEEQLAAIDATEPNYRRTGLPEGAAVSISEGCQLYAGSRGCLVARDGVPLPLTGQAALLRTLLADLPELARLVGADTPEGFVAATRRSAELRDWVRELWRRTGRVLPLERPPT
jgi:hypothetical protein